MKDYGKGRGRNARIAKAQRKADWNTAIRESRVVNFGGGIMKSYSSPEAAKLACDTANEDGIESNIVPAELAL